MSLRLSDKHGVNPTIPLCFWCSEQKNEVALLGKMRGDIEAPRHMVLDYDPCETCISNMEMGITIAEVSDRPVHDGQMAINGTRRDPHPINAAYPTGRWCVVREGAVEEIFTEDVLPAILKHRKAYTDRETFDALGLGREVEQSVSESNPAENS